MRNAIIEQPVRRSMRRFMCSDRIAAAARIWARLDRLRIKDQIWREQRRSIEGEAETGASAEILRMVMKEADEDESIAMDAASKLWSSVRSVRAGAADDAAPPGVTQQHFSCAVRDGVGQVSEQQSTANASCDAFAAPQAVPTCNATANAISHVAKLRTVIKVMRPARWSNSPLHEPPAPAALSVCRGGRAELSCASGRRVKTTSRRRYAYAGIQPQ